MGLNKTLKLISSHSQVVDSTHRLNKKLQSRWIYDVEPIIENSAEVADWFLQAWFPYDRPDRPRRPSRFKNFRGYPDDWDDWYFPYDRLDRRIGKRRGVVNDISW